MSNIVLPHTWVPLEIPTAANFNAVQNEIRDKFNTYAVQTDVAKTITVAHTFNADILFGDGLYDIGKSGATRPRDGFFSRNVTIGNILVVGTATTTGVGAGEMVLANAKAYKGAIAAGTATLNMMYIDTNNSLQLGHNDGDPATNYGLVKIGSYTFANLPAAAASRNGAICFDTTNNRFIYYTNGNRFQLSGVAF